MLSSLLLTSRRAEGGSRRKLERLLDTPPPWTAR
jgi:hypothetical protein